MIAGGDVTPSLHEDPPILVCADFQNVYLAEGRIDDAGAVTSQCLALLSLWRENLWPVLHLKRIAQAAWFDPTSSLTDWIAEFRPRPGEMVFEHPLPSAYSSTRFAEYMSSMKNVRCAMMGFSLDETILSTAIEGFHRGHRYQVIADAVACGGIGTGIGDAESYRLSMMKAVGNFAGVADSGDLIEAAAAIAV